ncbi:hypothetical protein WN48_01758 [Eufriesea mexicana]|uniref:Uncharacterized protein n=1 Tax=Eufriesea mexicana TaxID=516756 RepID=A0A310SCL1_9HYME|nr:hypothetical protein WN48_01758 [Eufriesea mexicana]
MKVDFNECVAFSQELRSADSYEFDDSSLTWGATLAKAVNPVYEKADRDNFVKRSPKNLMETGQSSRPDYHTRTHHQLSVGDSHTSELCSSTITRPSSINLTRLSPNAIQLSFSRGPNPTV